MPRTVVDSPVQVTTLDDVFRQGSGDAGVAALLQANDFDLECLRTNGMLPEDAWNRMDTRAIQAFTQTLSGIEDLRSRGLTDDLGDIGTLTVSYDRLSQMNEAEMSMWADIDAEQARLDRSTQTIPVPCIFKEWQLSIRLTAAANRGNVNLNTDHAFAAGKVVGEKLEQLLFNGNTTVYGNMPIYGYRTHPNRNTGSGSDFGTAANVYTTVEAMLEKMMDDGAPPPYVLYLHQTQYNESGRVNTAITPASSPRGLMLENHPELEDIKFSHQMTAGEAVMVSMNPLTVTLGIAEDLINVQWDSLGGLSTHFRTMTVAVPIIKADYEGRSGIVHYTGV